MILIPWWYYKLTKWFGQVFKKRKHNLVIYLERLIMTRNNSFISIVILWEQIYKQNRLNKLA